MRPASARRRTRPQDSGGNGSVASGLVTIAAFISAILLSVYVFAGAFRKTSVAREGIAIIGDPVLVVSWNRSDGTFAVFRIPKTVSVDAVFGYGTYTLESLWKLDGIEKRHGELYTRTMEELLGFPVRWYIDPSAQYAAFDRDTVAAFKSVFTMDRLVSVMPTNHSSMSAWDYIALHRAVSAARHDAVSVFDLDPLLVLYPDKLPDGTSITRIDSPRLDTIVANALEDKRVREEAVRIALYNTTAVPGLGQKMARILNMIGAFVVFVGNREPLVKACLVRGSAESLKTVTAMTVTELFGCTTEATGEQLRADVEVFVGSDYAERFMQK